MTFMRIKWQNVSEANVDHISAHYLLIASFQNNLCTFVALLPYFRCTFSAIRGDDLLCCSFIQHTRVLSQCKVHVVTSCRNLHRKEKVKLWLSSGVPGKRKWKLRVNLSATMLLTEFAAVGGIFADGHCQPMFFMVRLLPALLTAFSNCLDSWLHQTVSPHLAKTSSYSWAECHVKVDTLPDLRQCTWVLEQRSDDIVQNCHKFGTKVID